MARLRRLRRRREIKEIAQPETDPLTEAEMEEVLRVFLALAKDDPALQSFAGGRKVTVQYQLSDMDLQFCMGFYDGLVTADLGAPDSDAEVLLAMNADLLDSMLTGRTNAVRAAMAGKLSFSGDTRQAMAQQQIQADLVRLYTRARQDVLGESLH
jgi:autoinducer 2 (AI-2) kinase